MGRLIDDSLFAQDGDFEDHDHRGLYGSSRPGYDRSSARARRDDFLNARDRESDGFLADRLEDAGVASNNGPNYSSIMGDNFHDLYARDRDENDMGQHGTLGLASMGGSFGSMRGGAGAVYGGGGSSTTAETPSHYDQSNMTSMMGTGAFRGDAAEDDLLEAETMRFIPNQDLLEKKIYDQPCCCEMVGRWSPATRKFCRRGGCLGHLDENENLPTISGNSGRLSVWEFARAGMFSGGICCAQLSADGSCVSSSPAPVNITQTTTMREHSSFHISSTMRRPPQDIVASPPQTRRTLFASNDRVTHRTVCATSQHFPRPLHSLAGSSICG